MLTCTYQDRKIPVYFVENSIVKNFYTKGQKGLQKPYGAKTEPEMTSYEKSDSAERYKLAHKIPNLVSI